MKKFIICLLFVMIASQYSCKKFLNITPIDKLTGNNFYQTPSDIESNLTDMYGRLFDKYVQTNTAGGTGEFRSGEVIPAKDANGPRHVRGDVALLGGHTRRVPNSLTTPGLVTIPTTAITDRSLLDAIKPTDPVTKLANESNFVAITKWNEYYQVIQSANILISKLQEGISSLTAEQTNKYIEEAKFIRCYCYFFMVRVFGDVVYYTTAYQKDPLPRENMVSVVNKCIADLKTNKNDLPYAITDPALRGVRASRGAVIDLLMNMNMWNAGFDPANKTKYYTETEALGADIMGSNAFRLYGLAEWSTVTKGRSEESLFELFSTINYNASSSAFSQANLTAAFGEYFIHFPYRLPEYNWRSSPCVFTADYMKKLYPDTQDDRLIYWLEDAFNQNAETFQLKKFAGNTFIDSSTPSSGVPDNTFLIMRYADAILLRAEALAELGGQDGKAAEVLNVVRTRANATLFPGRLDGNIKDAIYLERQKELMGEGTHYFDLVRTKRILSKTYADNPLTADKFGRGAWTWPIDISALANNPQMTLNTYWTGTGIE